jgi:hypothetical protein
MIGLRSTVFILGIALFCALWACAPKHTVTVAGERGVSAAAELAMPNTLPS